MVRESRNTPHEGSTEISTSRVLEDVRDACILRAFVSAAETRDLVPPKDWITLGFDPNPSHDVVENLVFFQQTKT